jgi:hypothetical protein
VVILIQRERYITILARNVSKTVHKFYVKNEGEKKKTKGMRKMKGL